ncbi:MAG: carboxypeptidase regulatory-like domain-containing protein [Arenicella sp.]|nr:carboxypeptidase regulatory-like domain-containing protein [Arenicella sp.]
MSGLASAANQPSQGNAEYQPYHALSSHESQSRLSRFLSRYWYWRYCCNRAVTIAGGDSFESGEALELTAVLRRQRPGARYSWSQLAGPAAEFTSGHRRKNVSIKLPTTGQEETLVFKVRVKYANRWPRYAFKTVTVREPVVPVSVISGRILSVDGVAISNVTINATNSSGSSDAVLAQSDANGEFSLTLEPETQFVLQLSNPNFSQQVIPVVSPSANAEFNLNNLVMIARGNIHSIATNGQQTVAAQDGASVTFDKANFVDADGQPLIGDLQLTITPLDVSNTRSVSAFPGLFLGVRDGGVTQEMIVSLGTVEFHFTSNGEPASLASGATAEILIPIYVNQYPNGQPIETDQTAPLRSLNEATGIWNQEGIGTVVKSSNSPTGFAYQATVSHFSWWGSDVAIATTPGDTTPNTGIANAIITVSGPAGLSGVAVIEATATGLVNWLGSSVSTAVSIGGSSPTLPIPANREVCFIAYFYFDSGAIGTSNMVCVNMVSGAMFNLNVELGQTGPIDVSVVPELSDDTAFIQGFVNVQSPALRIGANTIETTINYQLLSGSLPAGLSLDIFGGFLNLIGIPTMVGEETFVIRATDADNFTDDITVTYNVSAVSPPPIIEEDTNRFFSGVITTPGGTVSMNLNDLVSNIGGPISQWNEVTTTSDQTECINMYASAGVKGPSADLLLPSSAVLDEPSGELTFNSAEFWLGCLNAVNNKGSSTFLFGFEIVE